MTVLLRADAKLVRVKLRRYSPLQAALSHNIVEELLLFGLLPQSQQSLGITSSHCSQARSGTVPIDGRLPTGERSD